MTSAEILTTAVEGDLDLWGTVTAIQRDLHGNVLEVEIHPAMYDDETFEAVTVGMEDIPAATEAVLKRYPNTRGAGYIRDNNIDAEAADMILQVACFDEIVYG